MTMLSLCMPSNRKFEASRRAIETALEYCAARDAFLVIADNSGDEEKRKYWSHHSSRLTYVITDGLDVGQNFLAAIGAAQTPFVIMMGDDDEIEFNPQLQAVDLASLPVDHIGVRPMTHVVTTSRGVVNVQKFSISGSDPATRIREYIAARGSSNSAFYSIFRKEPYLALMELFNHHHPTKGGYCDWAQVLALFAYGKMAYDPSTIFKYNMDQWSSKDMIQKQGIRLFVEAGLPADGQKYEGLLQFLDLFVFLSRARLPLSDEEKQNARAFLSFEYFTVYLNIVKQSPEKYSKTMQYLADMALNQLEIDTRFHIALMMADDIKPGLKNGYIEFYKAAMA
ncbi:hypothetical protein LJR030_004950 [Rhizobium sp. LjRoot30]|uniref:hypothetical protein n=1 Tax=Rhizobium sp. LjRoot30 TaxID=3342320 RepID=UPI003ECFB811